MDLDVDGATILYVLGVGFALAALAYFIRDVVFALSITVKAALLALAVFAFLVAGVALERDGLDTVALVLAGATYVVFVAYVVTRYGLAPTRVFLVLALSAAGFLALGVVVRERRPSLSARRAGAVLALILLVGTAFVGADVLGGGVTYAVALEDSVTVSADRPAADERELVPAEAQVGTLTATNVGPFTRPLSLPAPEACLAGAETGGPAADVYLDYRPRSYERPDRIAGGESVTYALVARVPVANDSGGTTLDVERGTDCETPREDPTLVVDVPAAGQDGSR